MYRIFSAENIQIQYSCIASLNIKKLPQHKRLVSSDAKNTASVPWEISTWENETSKTNNQPTNLLGWAAVKVEVMQIQNWAWNSCEDQFSEKNSVIQLFFLVYCFPHDFWWNWGSSNPSFGYFPENYNILTNYNFILGGGEVPNTNTHPTTLGLMKHPQNWA